MALYDQHFMSKKNLVILSATKSIFLTFCFTLSSYYNGIAQTTIWSENFEGCTNNTAVESGGCGWAIYNVTSSTNNFFAVTNNATYRINANKNLTVFGDPAGAGAVYSYDKWVVANEVAYYATKVNATNYTTLKLNYQWKAVGDGTSADHGAICYSSNGTTWNDLSPNLYNQSGNQTVTNFDISTLDLTQFYIGVRWVNDGNADGMPPIIVDDMSITGTVVLPIQLIGFNAHWQQNQINLSWETAMEKDNEKFEIERSFNGLNFKTIGTVKGNENSNKISKYSFADSDSSILFKPSIYYRLKQIDFDGKVAYSTMIVIETNAISNEINNVNIIIAPNPKPNDTFAVIRLRNFSLLEVVQVTVDDICGKNLVVNHFQIDSNGNGTFELTETLSTGIQILTVKSIKGIFTKKIMVN